MKRSARLLELKDNKQKGDIERNIDTLHRKNNDRAFNFVCATPGCGVSTILANLANYIMRKTPDRAVLLIDANFQAPAMHGFYGAEIQPGLSDALSGAVAAPAAIRPVDGSNLHLMTNGGDPTIRFDTIETELFAGFIAKLKSEYEYILIDTPPILTSSGSISISDASDVTFFLIESGETRREVAEKALGMLNDMDCAIGGIILNRVSQVIPGWLYRLF